MRASPRWRTARSTTSGSLRSSSSVTKLSAVPLLSQAAHTTPRSQRSRSDANMRASYEGVRGGWVSGWVGGRKEERETAEGGWGLIVCGNVLQE